MGRRDRRVNYSEIIHTTLLDAASLPYSLAKKRLCASRAN
jgi:hypothetical protein